MDFCPALDMANMCIQLQATLQERDKTDWPAWVQAVGSALAIFVSFIIFFAQNRIDNNKIAIIKINDRIHLLEVFNEAIEVYRGIAEKILESIPDNLSDAEISKIKNLFVSDIYINSIKYLNEFQAKDMPTRVSANHFISFMIGLKAMETAVKTSEYHLGYGNDEEANQLSDKAKKYAGLIRGSQAAIKANIAELQYEISNLRRPMSKRIRDFFFGNRSSEIIHSDTSPS